MKIILDVVQTNEGVTEGKHCFQTRTFEMGIHLHKITEEFGKSEKLKKMGEIEETSIKILLE